MPNGFSLSMSGNPFHSTCAQLLLFTFLLNFLLIFVFSIHEWTRLNKEWLTFLCLGLNPGTWKNLSHHIKTYQSFANCFQFSLLPLQTTHVCLFAAHLAVQGKSHATIRNYLNSLSTYGQLWGYPPLNLQNVFIHLTLRGILRTVKLESSIAQPLSLTMLNKMVNHMDFDHTIQVAAWVAIVISSTSSHVNLIWYPIQQLNSKQLNSYNAMISTFITAWLL